VGAVPRASGLKLNLAVRDKVALHLRGLRGVDQVAAVSWVERVLVITGWGPGVDQGNVGVAEISQPAGGAQNANRTQDKNDDGSR